LEKELLIQDNEMELLLNEVMQQYGYDFLDYSPASIKRRINRLISIDKFPSFAEFRHRVMTDGSYLQRFVEELTVNVTEMFRDPGFYRVLREQVLPELATHPFIRIWHAGCSTGEEVYSMAILLEEANLMHKSLLYATDINPGVLEIVSKGIFPMMHMKQYSENYIESGGTKDFSQYYTAKYDWAKFDESLSRKMIVSTHNLVSDRSFNEFQLIVCRNVLIYFDRNLQDRVLQLFDESLEQLGFLALGSKENLRFSVIGKKYKQVSGREKLWRKQS
jgi:chemotaxis protein methyltransferase CheR